MFGLSANPPTGLGGHAGIVRWAATKARLKEWGGAGADEVWVMPVYRHAFAAKREMASFEHRMKMARLAFLKLDGVKAKVRVIDVERRVQRHMSEQDPEAVPGTIDIVRWLKKKTPRAEFALLLGADTYRDLLDGRWKESEALLELVTVVALPRKGTRAKVPAREGVPQLARISSSSVRRSYREKADGLQDEVRAYIERNGLYGTARPRRKKTASRAPVPA